MFNFVLVTDAVKQMHKRPFIFFPIGKLNAVVGQDRVDVIRHERNQLS
jgi:hypothetical protein